MNVEIKGNVCIVKRENTDSKVYNESVLFYRIKEELLKQGYDVIKKLMWKDGHLYGDDTLHYIRSRKWNSPEFMMIYDNEYALRALYEPYNNRNEVTLNIAR